MSDPKDVLKRADARLAEPRQLYDGHELIRDLAEALRSSQHELALRTKLDDASTYAVNEATERAERAEAELAALRIPEDGPGSHKADLAEMRAQAKRADELEKRLELSKQDELDAIRGEMEQTARAERAEAELAEARGLLERWSADARAVGLRQETIDDTRAYLDRTRPAAECTCYHRDSSIMPHEPECPKCAAPAQAPRGPIVELEMPPGWTPGACILCCQPESEHDDGYCPTPAPRCTASCPFAHGAPFHDGDCPARRGAP
jgi:hypothetical protein